MNGNNLYSGVPSHYSIWLQGYTSDPKPKLSIKREKSHPNTRLRQLKTGRKKSPQTPQLLTLHALNERTPMLHQCSTLSKCEASTLTLRYSEQNKVCHPSDPSVTEYSISKSELSITISRSVKYRRKKRLILHKTHSRRHNLVNAIYKDNDTNHREYFDFLGYCNTTSLIPSMTY